MAQPKLNLGFIDSCGEKTILSLNVPTINAGNFATEMAKYTVTDTLNVIGKILALTACRAITASIHLPKSKQAETLPTAATAVRELGIMVSYQDNVNSKKYRFVIPGPAEGLLVAGTDNVDPENSDWQDFVTAFESGVLSEDGNAVTVLGGKLVGRNN